MESHAINVSLLSPNCAENSGIISMVTDMVNRVYEESESGLWVEGATRTNEKEIEFLTRSEEITVAHKSGQIMGCVRVEQTDSRIFQFGLLAVEPDFRGTGIGRQLVDFAEMRARKMNAAMMQLEVLTPREWKHPAKEFLSEWYARLGIRYQARKRLRNSIPIWRLTL